MSYLPRVPDDPVSRNHGALNALLPDTLAHKDTFCMHVVMHTETEIHAYAFGNTEMHTCSNARTDGKAGFHVMPF